MIKLDNKNITYVALADSNNSIKAPKEIWYADSNNSVKLVYRRKDALIEGEDYEKYHWLEGDGTAYIDTGIIVPTEKFVCITRLRNRETRTVPNSFLAFTVRQEQSAVLPFVSVNPRTDEQRYYVDLTNPRSFVPFGSGMFDINITMPSANTLQGDLMFFRSKNLSFGNSPWIGDISAFSLTSLDSTFRVEMQPCKLLKPVPKWLDANGIRRQVGECGMIDLVSGKFYGNVNSVGTFTVENYYERKEWLVGDGTAYIDTKVTSYTGVVSTKYSFVGSELNDINVILGRERADYTIDDWSSRLVFELNKSTGRLMLYGSGINWVQYLTTDTIDVDVVNNTFTTSTQSGLISVGDNVVGRNLFLFASNDGMSAQRPFHGKIAYLRIPNKLNLIPCILTMDLPASMDANNIARTKGTSGMWDLVSDRFYGNVASSGTFKAVNLAEGVDYEVHQWLVGDGAAYMFIGEYSDRVKFKVKLTSPSVDEGFVYGHNGALRTSRMTNVFIAVIPENRISNVQLPSTKEILIDFSEHLVYADDVQIAYTNKGSGANDESAFKRAYFWGTESLSIYRSDCSIGTIYADNQVFIPVKLLHSIPSKYDANGIARQVGECGMYDTVNDVFYGNVASSGTFTVSDD